MIHAREAHARSELSALRGIEYYSQVIDQAIEAAIFEGAFETKVRIPRHLASSVQKALDLGGYTFKMKKEKATDQCGPVDTGMDVWQINW